MEKTKNVFLNILTFICIIILVLTIIIFSVKKISENYLKKEKINKIISNINILDLFKDENGIELNEFNDIKNKLIDAGIPVESVEGFINSTPVNEYVSNAINKSITNTLNGENEKVITSEDLNMFFENNTATISKEMQENNIPNSEVLTKEKQEQFIEKIKTKTPEIESKINEISDKINEEIGFNLKDKIYKLYNMVGLINILFDLILIIIFIVFVIGLFILRKSIYKSLKWLGITFLSSSFILLVLSTIIPLTYSHLNDNSIELLIKKLFKNFVLDINKYVLLYLFIGIILILTNVIIYYINLKRENKKFEF